MKICVCGFTASGKSYQARRVASELQLEYVSGSEVLLEVAGVVAGKGHFWIGQEGIGLVKQRESDLSIDRAVDQLLLTRAREKNNIIFDSWTLPWLYKEEDLYKVYLAANLDARAVIAFHSRDDKPYSLKEIKAKIMKKDQDSTRLFHQLYGININDTSFFDLVIDNSELEADETFSRLVKAIKDFQTKS